MRSGIASFIACSCLKNCGFCMLCCLRTTCATMPASSRLRAASPAPGQQLDAVSAKICDNPHPSERFHLPGMYTLISACIEANNAKAMTEQQRSNDNCILIRRFIHGLILGCRSSKPPKAKDCPLGVLTPPSFGACTRHFQRNDGRPNSGSQYSGTCSSGLISKVLFYGLSIWPFDRMPSQSADIAHFHRRSGKPTSLGCFDHEEEAARAYDKMMLWCELHHTSGMKGGITNFDPSEYEKDLAWLHTVSQVGWLGHGPILSVVSEHSCGQ